MKANELKIIDFLMAQRVQFVIPIYQRNYDWTNIECNELLNDIIAVSDEYRESHFIGSIVFIHEGTYSTSEVKELVIIDGQQRLTTISILLVALYRIAKEYNISNHSERIYNIFLTNQYVQNEASKLKLKQTDSSSKAFEAILNGRETESLPYSNVIENYNFFRASIDENNFEIILQGLEKLIFVEISLERDKDDPQRIFESLNSTGLDLSQSDLIRNFILMDLPPKEQVKTFENVWNPIEENARNLTQQKSLVSEFIRDYLTFKTKKIPKKSKVYPEFKKRYADKKNEMFLQDMEQIKSLSFHYRKFINPNTEPDEDIRRELHYLNRLEINVVFPFLLQVYEDKENGVITKIEFIKILKLIQSYSWRRFIVGLPTSALNKVFMTLYSEVDEEDYFNSIAIALMKKRGSAKFPRNEEVKTALRDKDVYNTQSRNKSYFFELLENYNNREYVDTTNDFITIEHIFPQNPSKEWSEQISSGDYFSFKEKYLNTIANLTLSGNNGALGNKDFSSKKFMNVNGGEQGYVYSRLWLNKFLKEANVWDLNNFEKRLELIYNRFLNIWEQPIYEESFEAVEEEEKNIFDADEPRNKKLEYFIFENTKVETDAVAQMYMYVLKELYHKNSQLLTNGQQIFKITRDVQELRSGQELINGWYVEMNMDSNTKVNYLKKILSAYGLQDELMVKYNGEYADVHNSNRFTVRRKYWTQILVKLKELGLFENISPSKGQWLSTGAGISGIAYTMVVSRNFIRIELGISSSTKEENKRYFNNLFAQRKAIEANFGAELTWQELPDIKMSRIKLEKTDLNIYQPEDWEAMNSFILENMPKFVSALSPFIRRLK